MRSDLMTASERVRRPLWVRAGWLRPVIWLVVTCVLAGLWTLYTKPDPSEVDPPDDTLPIAGLIWLLILASGLIGFIASEVWVSRWRDSDWRRNHSGRHV